MPRLTRATLIGATSASGATALLGLAWVLGLWPSIYTDPDAALLARLAGQDAAATVHTVAALAGVATGIAALAGALGARGRAWAAALQLVVFGLVLQSGGTLSTVGYLVAMAMPAAVVVLLVQVVRRYRVARWVVGVPVLAGLAIGGFLARDALVGVVVNLGTGLADNSGGLITSLLFIAVGGLWATVGVQALSGASAMDRATAWVLRHRRAITIVAATGPLPYALVRLTWLTPWPQLGADMDLSIRIWGLTLSSGAWLGFFLTIGLIRPWGEVFPRWMPGLAGRRVPIAAAGRHSSMPASRPGTRSPRCDVPTESMTWRVDPETGEDDDMQATTRHLARYLARRFAWHMLGAAIGLALALLVYGLLYSAVTGLPAWLVVVVAVAAAVGLGLVPGARELEVTAARALLDVDGELVVPAEPRLAHRVRTAAWVVAHLVTGMFVGVCLFAVLPGAVLVAVEAVAGRPFGSELPLPDGPVEVTVRLAACVVVGLLALVATWPLGVAASALAGRVLGPTPHDRMETALARASREAEHTRLARELHDGIGHALTVVSVQAAAGRRVVAANPDAAAEALGAIEETARSALAELDQLLAVLRDDADDCTPVALAPALDDVVSAHRRAGLDLSARIDLPAGLPALLSRTVQRIVTEALTNAHRHGAPGPVGLTVGHDRDEVRIEVVNPVRAGARPGRRPSGGRGLSGIRERVALFGGTAQAGPDGDRWVLRAMLPCTPLPRAEARAGERAGERADVRTNRKDSDA